MSKKPVKKTTSRKEEKRNKTSKDLDGEWEDKIREYFKMSCEMCDTVFTTFIGAKQHYKNEHKVLGFLLCCQKKFFSRNRIIDHIKLHLNPEAFKYIVFIKKCVIFV